MAPPGGEAEPSMQAQLRAAADALQGLPALLERASAEAAEEGDEAPALVVLLDQIARRTDTVSRTQDELAQSGPIGEMKFSSRSLLMGVQPPGRSATRLGQGYDWRRTEKREGGYLRYEWRRFEREDDNEEEEDAPPCPRCAGRANCLKLAQDLVDGG